MTEQTAQAEQQPATEATPEPTLESLYQEYNVAQPEPQTAAPTTPTEQQPAGNDVAAIQQDLATLRQELAAERQRQAQNAEESDLKNAVATLGEQAGLKDKDLMLRGYLIAKANEDQRLRALWDKRGENPTAWNKALNILAGEVKREFQVPNPQLEENQRAMEESQKTSSATAPAKPSFEDEAMKMSDAEFQSNVWARLVGRG